MPRDYLDRIPLHYAAAGGGIEVASTLLSIVNDSKLINPHANEEANFLTPLHVAVTYADKRFVKFMLQRITGNPNPKNKPGFKELGTVTPLDLALHYALWGNPRLPHTLHPEIYPEIAKLVLDKVQQKKLEDHDKCHHQCPTSNDNTRIQCYQPDLLLGI